MVCYKQVCFERTPSHMRAFIAEDSSDALKTMLTLLGIFSLDWNV